MILLVQCPTCRKEMKYQPQAGVLKAKKCVYCGTTFTVNRERIVKRTSATAPIIPQFLSAKKQDL